MPIEEPSVFQQVLEALERARDAGEEALRGDERTMQQDDHDCYPRGIRIDLPRGHEARKALRFLAKNLNWVSFGTHMLNLEPRIPIKFRLSGVSFLNSVAESLRKDGIPCVPDIYWR